MKKFFLMIAIAMALCGCLQAAVTWDVGYEGSVLPNLADPAWSAIGTQSPRTSSLNDGILTITNNSAGWEGWAINAGSYWEAETTLTLEIKMKQAGTSRVEFGKSNRQWSLVFKDNEIQSRFGGDSMAFDTTEWNVFRITKESGVPQGPGDNPDDVVKLYINGSLVASDLVISHAGTYDFNLVRVMKMSGGGTMDIDYIRYTNEGAFAPVPEPATLAILGLGMAFANRRRNR